MIDTRQKKKKLTNPAAGEDLRVDPQEIQIDLAGKRKITGESLVEEIDLENILELGPSDTSSSSDSLSIGSIENVRNFGGNLNRNKKANKSKKRREVYTKYL